ncbi:MAG TPA: methyltransferase domain-containing protein [Gemmatimonadaceae bacterium]|nr:methyltransferase domain-containing protein [Gemmatimonadaceae bacterium]
MESIGIVLHGPARYDLLVWLLTLGRELGFRDKLLRLARLETGMSALDVGCGTGSLAIAAKRHVGPSGTVCGIDASPEMIARATKKAKRARMPVDFQQALAQALPFPDARFDAVLSTVMLHHLTRPARPEFAREVRRVLKPGGHVLVVDFGPTRSHLTRILPRLHRHGRTNLGDTISLFEQAGLDSIDSGAVGMNDLHFVLAARWR